MVLEPRDPPPGRSFVGMQWFGKSFLSIIIAIAAGFALVRWPNIDSCTCLLQPSVAKQRSQYQVTERLHQGKRRLCKTPQNHHTNQFIYQQQQLPPNKRRQQATATADTVAMSRHFFDINSDKRDIHNEDQDEDKKADTTTTRQRATHQQR